jgi:hypothetical protein
VIRESCPGMQAWIYIFSREQGFLYFWRFMFQKKNDESNEGCSISKERVAGIYI